MKLTPELRADYERKWATCEIDYEPEQVKKTAARVLANKPTYTGFWQVPWWFIAMCDLRECNMHPRGVLHNGELIVGTNKKTTIVPIGRGPFATKRDSILDSVQLQGLDKETDWSVGKTLFRLEGYNGYGYQSKGVPSPYLWSHTNHYADGAWDDDPKGGKYIRDHVWSADVYDKQLGACSVLKALMTLDTTIQFGASAPVATQPVDRLRDGDAVKRLQIALRAGGVDPGPIDGVIGEKTIRAFQIAQKIHVDGKIGPQTRPLLNEALASI